VFEKVVDALYDDYRGDRRLVKDLLHDANLEVGPATTFEAFVGALTKFEADNPPSDVEDAAKDEEKKTDADVDMEKSGDSEEKKDEGAKKKALPFAALVASGSKNIKLVFTELHELVRYPCRMWTTWMFDGCIVTVHGWVGGWVAQALEEAERRAKKLRRRQEHFEELLEDYFYRSDHVGTSWEDAQRKLRSHTAYKDLRRYPEARLETFNAYMAKLAEVCNKVGVTPAGVKQKRPRDDADAEEGAGAPPATKARRVGGTEDDATSRRVERAKSEDEEGAVAAGSA